MSRPVSVALSGAVWSSCQRVSHFCAPHCGPLSCSCLQLNGPFDGPPEAFHRAPCHRARGLRGGTERGGCLTTPGRYAKPCAQTKTKATLSGVYWKLISSLQAFFFFAFIKHRMEKEQDDLGRQVDRKWDCANGSKKMITQYGFYIKKSDLDNFTLQKTTHCEMWYGQKTISI